MAGVIGAVDNDIGFVGVSPESKIYVVRGTLPFFSGVVVVWGLGLIL
jgi:hypothetical protein